MKNKNKKLIDNFLANYLKFILKLVKMCMS